MAEGIPSKLAWGKRLSNENEQESSPIVSFIEIMEEQEHEVFQKKNLKNFLIIQDELEHIRTHDSIELATIENTANEDQDYLLALELSRDPDCSADELLAIKMQREFDREYELSQVSLNLNNFIF